MATLGELGCGGGAAAAAWSGLCFFGGAAEMEARLYAMVRARIPQGRAGVRALALSETGASELALSSAPGVGAGA